MTTCSYSTTSNTVKLADPVSVKSLLQEKYHPEQFSIEPEFNREDGTLAINAYDHHDTFCVLYNRPDSPGYGYCTEEFLEALAPHLAETFEIKMVETQGCGEPSCSKYVIEPDGTVELHQF
jgi:hypothetical protein